MQQHEVNHKYELLPKIRTHAFEYVDEKTGNGKREEIIFSETMCFISGAGDSPLKKQKVLFQFYFWKQLFPFQSVNLAKFVCLFASRCFVGSPLIEFHSLPFPFLLYR